MPDILSTPPDGCKYSFSQAKNEEAVKRAGCSPSVSFKKALGYVSYYNSKIYRDSLKGWPVLLTNSQAGPGRNFSHPFSGALYITKRWKESVIVIMELTCQTGERERGLMNSRKGYINLTLHLLFSHTGIFPSCLHIHQSFLGFLRPELSSFATFHRVH